MNSHYHITDECVAALDALRGELRGELVLPQLLAMLALKRARMLPPPQQSFSLLAQNTQHALSRLAVTNTELANLDQSVSFSVSADSEPIDPTALRAAQSILFSLPIDNDSLYAPTALALVERCIDLALPLEIETLAAELLPVSRGNSVFAIHCGSAELITQLVRKAHNDSPFVKTGVPIRIALCEDRPLFASVARLLMWFHDFPVLWVECGNGSFAIDKKFDLICYTAVETTPQLSTVYRLMSEHSTAVTILSESQYDKVDQAQMKLLLDNDVLDSVVRVSSRSINQVWYLLLLRARKSIGRRHRVMFYHHRAESNLSRLDIESILDEVTKTTGERSALVHRNDLADRPNPFTDVDGLVAQSEAKGLHEFSRQGFHSLDTALIERGFNCSSCFSLLNDSAVVEPAFADASLIRVAVSSAPSLKNTEVRTEYAFALWWDKWLAAFAGSRPEYYVLRRSFEHDLSAEGAIKRTQLRAIFDSWFECILHDYTAYQTKGSHFTTLALLRRFTDMSESLSVEYWYRLDQAEKIFLESLNPALGKQINDSNASVSAIQNQQQRMRFNGAEQIVDTMLRRRETRLLTDTYSPQIRYGVVQDRIRELSSFISEQKNRMRMLHQNARLHREQNVTAGGDDSTLGLQDEIGRIFSLMVPAQSELKMLEHSVLPYSELQRNKEREKWKLERRLSLLAPVVKLAGSELNPEDCTNLLMSYFREKLAMRIEEALVQNREEIISIMEEYWKNFSNASLSPNR